MSEYTISGFMAPDEPGMNILRDRPPEPFMLKTVIEPRPLRSVRWWLTRWWPKVLRVRMCWWYGHPQRCMERYSVTEVIATTSRVNDAQSWTFEATGNYCRGDETCHLCGWEHHVQF